MVDFFAPQSLTEALAIRSRLPVIPLAGGTDLMVRKRSWAGTLPQFERPVLFLGGIDALKEVQDEGGWLTIGAAVSLSALIETPAAPDILKRAIMEMASPAIRNVGTLGGNICNASPAADTLPPLYALDAALVLESAAGRREMAAADFITGPGQTALREDELVIAVKIPRRDFNAVYYKKVGTRKADALSKVSFAGLARVADGAVAAIRIALGAVAPCVVRNKTAEDFMIGQKVSDLPGLLPEIKKFYEPDIQPIDDQRSNAAYRGMVSFRLIEDFVTEVTR